VLQVATIVKRARNAIRTPFGIQIGKLLELSIGYRVLVDEEVIEGNRVFRDFIPEQFRGVDAESLYKDGDLGGIDSHLDSASGN